MSTRRRLANRDRSERADLRTVITELHVCQHCRREFAKGTRADVLERHRASHNQQEADQKCAEQRGATG